MTDDSDRPSVPPRAMTPYEWGSSSKLPVAKPAIDPLASVARLFPRDPRTPAAQSISEFERQRQERAARDTDVSGLTDEDKTPAERPFEIRVERELKELKGEVSTLRGDVSALQTDVSAIKATSRDAAQHSLDTHELVKAMVKSMVKRQQAFDLERRWIPWIFRAATIGIALWALSRTFHW